MFFELLPAFACARAVGNLWNVCLRANIWSPLPLVVSCFASDNIEE